MYKVIYKFIDLKDNKHLYNVGDEYPRNGAKADKSRIDELKSEKIKSAFRLLSTNAKRRTKK